MEWKNNILIGLLLVCVGALLSMILTKSCSTPRIEQIEIVKRDTLVVEKIDTLIVEKPVPYKVMIVDTIYIESNDDSKVLVQEIKEYGDSTYYARISGINAFLEEWRTYPKTVTEYITTTETILQKPQKWVIGLQGGIGITPKGVQPYLGVGVTRRFAF